MIFLSPQSRDAIQTQYGAAITEVFGEGDSTYRNLLAQYADPLALLNDNPASAQNRTKDRIYPRQDPTTGEYVIGINHKVGRTKSALRTHEEGMSFSDALRQFKQDADLAARQSDRYIRANRLTDMPAQIGEALTGLTLEYGPDAVRELDLANSLRQGDFNAAAESIRRYDANRSTPEGEGVSVREEPQISGQPGNAGPIAPTGSRESARERRAQQLARNFNDIGRQLASPQTQAVSYADTVGLPRVANQTRDEIENFASTPQGRVISGDFNSVSEAVREQGYEYGFEIIMPRDSTPQELESATQYLDRLEDFYESNGLERRNRGVKVVGVDTNRGVDGVIHVEPFFAEDIESRRAIENDPQGYAALSIETLGELPGSRFIPPHRQNDPGAITPDGVSERDWWSDTLYTHFSETLQEPLAPTPQLPITSEAEEVGVAVTDLPPVPQVSFEETQLAALPPANAPAPVFTEDTPQVTFQEEFQPAATAFLDIPSIGEVDPLLLDDGALVNVLASSPGEPVPEPGLASRFGSFLRDQQSQTRDQVAADTNIAQQADSRARGFFDRVGDVVGNVAETYREVSPATIRDAQAASAQRGFDQFQADGGLRGLGSDLFDAARRNVVNTVRNNPADTPFNQFLEAYTGQNPADVAPIPGPTLSPEFSQPTTAVGPPLPEPVGPPVPAYLAQQGQMPLTGVTDGFAREPLSQDQSLAARGSRTAIAAGRTERAQLDAALAERALVQPEVDGIFDQITQARVQDEQAAALARENEFVELTRQAAENRTLRNLRTVEDLTPNATGTNVALTALDSLAGLNTGNSTDALRALVGASESGSQGNLFGTAVDQQARAFSNRRDDQRLAELQAQNQQAAQPLSDFDRAVRTQQERTRALGIYNRAAGQNALPQAPPDIFASEDNLTAAQEAAAARRELEEQRQRQQAQLTRILSHPDFIAATERLRTGRR